MNTVQGLAFRAHVGSTSKTSLRRLGGLFASLLFASAALLDCSAQGEGARCNADNNDADCADGLVCKRAAELGGNADICCPTDDSKATSDECVPNGNGGSTSSSPPAGGSGAGPQGGSNEGAGGSGGGGNGGQPQGGAGGQGGQGNQGGQGGQGGSGGSGGA